MKSHQIRCLGNHLELDISKNIGTIIRGGFPPPRNRPLEASWTPKTPETSEFSWLSFPHDFIEVLWISTNCEATRMNLRHPKKSNHSEKVGGGNLLGLSCCCFFWGGGRAADFVGSRSPCLWMPNLGSFALLGNITSSFLVRLTNVCKQNCGFYSCDCGDGLIQVANVTQCQLEIGLV